MPLRKCQILVIVFSLSFYFQGFAQTKKNNTVSNIDIKRIIGQSNYELDLSIYSFNADSTQVSALKGGMRLGLMIKGKSGNNFNYYGKMNIFFEEGSFRSYNDDSFSQANTYGVEEAYFKWMPLQYFHMKAGISKVSKKHHSLFINPPALGTKLNVRPFDFDFFELDVFSLINTISQDSTQSGTGQLKGRASYYLITGVDTKLKTDYLDFNFHYKHFSFNKLTSEYAFKSRFRGSSVTGTGELSSTFTNNYKGHYLSTSIHLKNTTLSPVFRAEFIKNTQSEDTGKLVGINLKTEHFKYRVELFENEKDTLPAAIVSPYYGGTNRKGSLIGLTYLNKNYTIGIDYYKLDTIAASPFQDQLDIVFIEFARSI